MLNENWRKLNLYFGGKLKIVIATLIVNLLRVPFSVCVCGMQDRWSSQLDSPTAQNLWEKETNGTEKSFFFFHFCENITEAGLFFCCNVFLPE